jgi:hypothetical protein
MSCPKCHSVIIELDDTYESAGRLIGGVLAMEIGSLILTSFVPVLGLALSSFIWGWRGFKAGGSLGSAIDKHVGKYRCKTCGHKWQV